MASLERASSSEDARATIVTGARDRAPARVVAIFRPVRRVETPAAVVVVRVIECVSNTVVSSLVVVSSAGASSCVVETRVARMTYASSYMGKQLGT